MCQNFLKKEKKLTRKKCRYHLNGVQVRYVSKYIQPQTESSPALLGDERKRDHAAPAGLSMAVSADEEASDAVGWGEVGHHADTTDSEPDFRLKV